jgi:multiple sugar transport system ATP-binding protein
MTLAVEVVELTKRFPGADRDAVDAVSFATREGEFLVLLGPSGCGKTTLLRMIGGLERQTAGSVCIGGNEVDGLPPRARGIAMVFQSYALYPHKSVRDNILFPLRAARLGRAEQVDRLAWATELLGIGALLERKPRHLSGGERQRVALALVMAGRAADGGLPGLVSLDEPTRGMDRARKEELASWAGELAQRGACVVVATHDVEFASVFAKRVVLLGDGELIADGPVAEILSGGWYFATEVARILGAAGAISPERGAELLRRQLALEGGVARSAGS